MAGRLRRLVLLLFSLLCVCCAEPFTIAIGGGIVASALAYLYQKFEFGDSCPLVQDPVNNLKDTLLSRIRGQPVAISGVVSAYSAFSQYAQVADGSSRPLVLAFIGPTGVGKTETANLMAEAIFAKRIQVGDLELAKGLLRLNGAEYNDPAIPTSIFQQSLKRRIVDHVQSCPHAAVLFDEVHKVAPNTLDVLVDSLGDRSLLSYINDKGEEVSADLSATVFILISDVEETSFKKLLLDFETRDDLLSHQSKLERLLNRIMDEEWQRLKFTGRISAVVPFLPLEPTQILEIVSLRLELLNQEGINRKWWRQLFWDESLLILLSSSHCIQYQSFSIQAQDGERKTFKKQYATYGARQIDKQIRFAIKSRLITVLKSSISDLNTSKLNSNSDSKGEPLSPFQGAVEANEIDTNEAHRTVRISHVDANGLVYEITVCYPRISKASSKSSDPKVKEETGDNEPKEWCHSVWQGDLLRLNESI
eukprot:GILK01012448.1.p1 GENE.GILK01012448.1~~GILK01012448.1.p1  ORF type:complete len:478 (+),score=77.10 GILK01012448.1:35-1468(+)